MKAGHRRRRATATSGIEDGRSGQRLYRGYEDSEQESAVLAPRATRAIPELLLGPRSESATRHPRTSSPLVSRMGLESDGGATALRGCSIEAGTDRALPDGSSLSRATVSPTWTEMPAAHRSRSDVRVLSFSDPFSRPARGAGYGTAHRRSSPRPCGFMLGRCGRAEA